MHILIFLFFFHFWIVVILKSGMYFCSFYQRACQLPHILLTGIMVDEQVNKTRYIFTIASTGASDRFKHIQSSNYYLFGTENES